MEIIRDIYAESAEEGIEFIESISYGDSKDKEDTERKWVRCRNCHYKIALLSDKININHTDTHIFENPAGIIYRVVCFSSATGSINISGYTKENTWFNGYLWCITVCRACNNHLGWHYFSGSGEFYGLIADRLTGI